MPLLDHFRHPVDLRRRWESFHTRWATVIADTLDRMLPRRYLAQVQVHLGSQIEADVAEFEREDEAEDGGNGKSSGEGGVAVHTWAPAAATLVIPAVFPEETEVQILEAESARLVAVVELLSPANKDRPDTRHAFAIKCAAYLQRGIGLIVADLITSRHFNLHNELMNLLNLDEPYRMQGDPAIYAVAYRPARRQETNQIDAWPVPLAVGETLPVLPLGLLGRQAIPLDLEATYTEARARCRL